MKSTNEAILAGYEIDDDGAVFAFGDGYKLALEPLHSGQFYVALYQGEVLLTEKVPVRPIAKLDADDRRRPENQMPGPR